ncbi:MAG: carboxypeptidase regulatory-like domain-containing protein [Chloracidobacterium sp.]|nr:carboxypeptidase regulatory-like domain-containing protein [Chloracidobacterium sp.]
MLRCKTSSRRVSGRIGLFFVISAMFLTITAAGANAAGFSFLDSVKEFFGLAPITQTASSTTTHALSVLRAGSGGGQVTSNPAGIDCPGTCDASFSSGQVVTLSAAPDSSSTFAGWSGDCSGTSSTCDVTMDAAKSVTAQFNPREYTLSVALSGTGGGTVSSGDGQISCGSACSASYSHGTVVSLTAVPSADSTFVSWTGEPCAGLPENCDVTMSQARSVTATFAHRDFVVTDPGTALSGTYHDVSFAPGACVTAFLATDVTITGAMTVPSCASLETNGHRVLGSGSFALSNGGALYISDAYGITTPFSTVSCPVGADCGSIQTSSRSFSSEADYIYNGATDQIVGNALPEVVRNLHVVSPPGALTDTRVDGYSPQTVTGTLQITGASSTAKKEFKGHVTLLKRPATPCTEIDSYHHVVVGEFGKLTLGCDVTVSGDWAMSSSGQLAGDFAVTFNGSSPGEQNITGDTAFYKLQAGFIYATSPPPADLRVHGTITISNKVVLFGGQSDMLSISGQDNGTGTGTNDPWSMCAIGERDIQFVSVSDSNATCSGSPVVATDSIEGGGNTNWLFGNTVTVVKDGTGGGTVTSQPAGIDCGTTCSAVFSEGTMVTLTAVPNSNSQLGPWGGDCAGQPPAVCQLSGVLPIVPRNVLKTFFLDTTAPTVTIESVSPNPITPGMTPAVAFTSTEVGEYEVMIGGEDCDDGDVFASGTTPVLWPATIEVHPDPALFLRGSNTIRVCVRDAAGNESSAATTVHMQSCTAPDNGPATLALPAECRLLGGPIVALNGLPPGNPIRMSASLDSLTDVSTTPGGPLGGEQVSASAQLKIRYKGWDGTIKGRVLPAPVEFAHGPRQTTSLEQSFDSQITRLDAQLPAGDPDFDLLRITAGSSFGLPSPGHTTLIRESPTLPRWSVDSFFDVFYTVEFVGRAGGPLSGMSGSTTGTIRMSAVSGPRQSTSCSVADNGTGSVDLPAQCPSSGWPLSMSTSVAPDSTIVSDWTISDWVVSSRVPGGSLGGDRTYSACKFLLDLDGISSLSSYMRSLTIPNGECVMDTAPRSSGQPVQSFDTDMFRVYGQITGDPDFDLLRVSCGSSFGLPSPGHTTLRANPSTSSWDVSSVSTMSCMVEFDGRPGGRLHGMSGSTTGTIRMQQGLPDNALTVTKGGGGGGTVTSSPAGIDCGSQCSAEFQSGTVVTLSAAPSSGSSFAGWSGACTGTGACDVTMDQARSVTATFTSPDFVVSSSGAIPPGTYRDVTYTGCFTATLSGDIVVTGSMTVASCQTLDTNGFIVFGGGSFALESGGALYVTDPNGITKRSSSVTCPNGQCGSIQTETRSYSSSADYTYSGATNQLVGDGLPETVRNLFVVSPPSATTSTRLDGYSPQVVTGKISVSGNSGSGKKEFKGHVTLLKRPTANSPCASDDFHDVEILAGGKMTLGCDITVSGDWTMATGGELTGDYSVTLDGDDQTVSGDTSFYNFRKLSPGQTLIFPPLSRITVTNDLTLHGASGSLLTIGGGGTSGSHWEMCALGTRSVDFVSVSNSDASCSGLPITATNSIDGGNNINWNFFVPTPTATNTNTPTSTPTSTATNTNTPTPTPTCGAYIPVSMPNLHSSTNGVVVVPVTTGDVSSSGVLSADLTVTFDPTVLSLPGDASFGVSLGSVATSNGGRFMDAFSPSSGTLRVSIYGTQPMIGGGDLVYLTFNVIGSPGTSSPLSFSLFRYNEASPCTSATNGSVTVTGSISGTVIYGNPVTGPNPRPVPNVLVTAFGSSLISSLTSSLGTYVLSGFDGGSYNVIPSKSGGVNNAISSFDAARVSQYVTGRITFTPAQLFVADVSSTSGVTSFDAAMIARFVSALGPPQGSTGLWRFGPSIRSHATVSSHIAGEDYFAHLMGEVSGNWGDPSPFRPAIGPERLTAVVAPNIVAPASKEVIVPISVDGATGKDVIAYEFDLRYDPSVIQPQAEPFDVAGTLSSSLFVVVNAETPGLLRVVVYGTEPLDGSGVLLNLKFTAVGAPGTVSPLTWERVMFNEGDPRTLATDGTVELSASAPNQAELTGRVVNTMGQGISNARVTLTDTTTGAVRSAMSNGSGAYRFGGLTVGQTYTVSVDSKHSAFAPLTVSITGQSVNTDMAAAQ